MTRRPLGIALLLATLVCRPDWQYATVVTTAGVPPNMATAGEPAHPAIVFVHGIGQSHYRFVRQLKPAPAEEYYRATFDLRGHDVSGRQPTDVRMELHRLRATAAPVWRTRAIRVSRSTDGS